MWKLYFKRCGLFRSPDRNANVLSIFPFELEVSFLRPRLAQQANVLRELDWCWGFPIPSYRLPECIGISTAGNGCWSLRTQPPSPVVFRTGKLAQVRPLLVRQALPALAMAEPRPGAEELEAEEQPGSSATSSGDSADPLSEYFVRHKVRLTGTRHGQLSRRDTKRSAGWRGRRSQV